MWVESSRKWLWNVKTSWWYDHSERSDWVTSPRPSASGSFALGHGSSPPYVVYWD